MCCTNTHRSKGCTCRVERYWPVNTGARKSFRSVILGQRFTTRSLTTPPTKNDMTPQADCKYLAVSPTNQQKKAGKPHPSDDSATLHDPNECAKSPQMLCAQQTPQAMLPSGHRRQVSCSCGHSLPRTDEPTVCLASSQRPASSIQQRRSSDVRMKSEPPDWQGCCTLDRVWWDAQYWASAVCQLCSSSHNHCASICKRLLHWRFKQARACTRGNRETSPWHQDIDGCSANLSIRYASWRQRVAWRPCIRHSGCHAVWQGPPSSHFRMDRTQPQQSLAHIFLPREKPVFSWHWQRRPRRSRLEKVSQRCHLILKTCKEFEWKTSPASHGTSRSVLDRSWFGLRPFPCVKGSYLRLDFKKTLHLHWDKRNTKSSEDSEHTRFNSKPCMMRCHLQLACQQKLCIKIHMLTVISVYTEISAPKKRPEIWSFPLLLRRINLRTTTRIRQKLNEHLHILFQQAKPHVQNNVYETCDERMTYNLCSCSAPEGKRKICVI